MSPWSEMSVASNTAVLASCEDNHQFFMDHDTRSSHFNTSLPHLRSGTGTCASSLGRDVLRKNPNILDWYLKGSSWPLVHEGDWIAVDSLGFVPASIWGMVANFMSWLPPSSKIPILVWCWNQTAISEHPIRVINQFDRSSVPFSSLDSETSSTSTPVIFVPMFKMPMPSSIRVVTRPGASIPNDEAPLCAISRG